MTFVELLQIYIDKDGCVETCWNKINCLKTMQALKTGKPIMCISMDDEIDPDIYKKYMEASK